MIFFLLLHKSMIICFCDVYIININSLMKPAHARHHITLYIRLSLFLFNRFICYPALLTLSSLVCVPYTCCSFEAQTCVSIVRGALTMFFLCVWKILK